MNTEEFIYVKKKIRDLTQFDLDNYGYNQMIRRLDGYISRYKVDNVAQYFKMIERDKNELEKLQKFLTINVSEFFRDPAQYKILQEEVLPELLRKNLRINIWSAGCSNGAEAYSIAILLERLSPYRDHRILATDIDRNILSQAAAGGPYKVTDIRNVPKNLVEKYFTNTNGDIYINNRIRKKITFKLHDLTRDPFEKNFDLIVCRNVIIYFAPETKKAIKRLFLDSLKVNGILFIGATETMLDTGDSVFQRLSACFYRKKAGKTEKDIQESLLSNKGVR